MNDVLKSPPFTTRANAKLIALEVKGGPKSVVEDAVSLCAYVSRKHGVELKLNKTTDKFLAMVHEEIEAEEKLDGYRKMIPIGTTVYTLITHRSSSGMSRRVKMFVVSNGKIEDIGYVYSNVTGNKWNDDGSITVGGCGFDAGFHVVHNLSYYLHGKESKGNCRNMTPASEMTPDNFNPGYTLEHRKL